MATTRGPAADLQSVRRSVRAERRQPDRPRHAGLRHLGDVGTRYYTYASTMHRAMVAARAHDLGFVVLDRPDPIDGIDVAGPVVVPPPILRQLPLAAHPRHDDGRTGDAPECGRAPSASRSAVTMRGWRREDYGDATGLPWVNPSPNLRSVDEALLYPATGLLESTNLSVGRGTDAPFQRVSAMGRRRGSSPASRPTPWPVSSSRRRSSRPPPIVTRGRPATASASL